MHNEPEFVRASTGVFCSRTVENSALTSPPAGRPSAPGIRVSWSARRRIGGLGVLLAMATLFASPPAAGCAELSGQVLSGQSEEPIAGAKVELTLQSTPYTPTYSVFTDPAGAFSFRDVQASSYQLAAKRAGYVSGVGLDGPEGKRIHLISVRAGEEVHGLILRIWPTAALSGRVVDEEGFPLQGFSVALVQPWGSNGLAERYGASTDGEGRYALSGVRPGRYVLCAYQTDRSEPAVGAFQPASDKPVPRYWAETYYPAADSFDNAAAFDLGAGENKTGINFRLARQRLSHFRIHLDVASDAGPRTGGRLLLQRVSSRAKTKWTYLQPDCEDYQVSQLTPGEYEIAAVSDYKTGTRFARKRFQVTEGNPEDIVLQLERGVGLTGRVRYEGAPPEWMPRRLGSLSIRLGPQNWLAPDWNIYGDVRLDGTFAIQAAPQTPLAFRLENLLAGSYLASVTLGDRRLEEGFTLSRGDATKSLDFTLRLDGATAKGCVYDGSLRAVPDATVKLISESSRQPLGDLSKSASTDEAGCYELRDVPPGRYTIYAFDYLASYARTNPAFLDRFRSQGTALTLRSRETHKQDLQLLEVGVEWAEGY